MHVAVHDILIVGAGGAGLRAATVVAEMSPSSNVALISKVYPMRSHTVSAEGGAAGVVAADDSLDEHAYDTISGSDWLADQNIVELFVESSPRELTQLEQWGCPWSREAGGEVAVRPFGGMKHKRTWFAADKTGFHLLHTLFQTTLRIPSIHRYDECFVTSLLVHNGRCLGAVAIDIASGERFAVGAKAVILATGGAGRVYRYTTNAAISTGDGMALAYRAGAPLKDLEFVQYHPTCLPETGILITEAARGEGGILVNRDGYRYLQDYNLGKPLDVHDPRHPQLRSMELGPRDWLSQAFVKESEKGRTIPGPHGDVVHLDVRFLGERTIDDKLPFIRELCLKFAGMDPVRTPIPVRPGVHYMMGGIHIDSEGATPVPGLFAAGECACASLNGANRLGSNSLPEILVFGSRAARSAQRLLDENPDLSVETISKLAEEQGRAVLERFGTGRPSRGSEKTASIAEIRDEMNTTMEAGAGIYRDERSLKKTCDALGELRERYSRIRLVDSSRTFSTELTAALELGFMLDVSEALAHSALARKESRGSHQRTDHPRRDDEQFLKHTLAYRTEGVPRIEYLDVVITRWPPGERKYGA